jgi:two-component system, NtrC family, nitrogen regulation response regulator GlnG
MSRDRSAVTALLDDGPVHSRQVQGGTFLVIKGPDRDARIKLGDAPLSFGSGAQCSLVLNDSTVSRKHFVVELVDGEILVSDCDSTNGIKIGNLRVERAAIGFGTEIRLGRTVIKFVPDEELVAPEATEATAFGSIIGADLRMRQLFTLLEEVAATNATVLIEGETGTGKELIAEEIHRHSPRRNGPFVVFDCSTVPRDLVASILFGHLKGAYTGAITDRRGIFAEASGGTVFLDEIGEMELGLQPALLRALDKRAVCRVGATVAESFDVRVVAATHRELRAEIANKRFREDLYYRLAVIRVAVPPLRDRGTDIPRLVEHFAERLRPGVTIAPEAMTQLLKHDWPGNVRELRNVMERACVLARNNAINLDGAITDEARTTPAISTDLPFKEVKRQVVEAFEREYIEALLQRHHMNLSAASREAQLDRKHMRELVHKYGLAPRSRAPDADADE